MAKRIFLMAFCTLMLMACGNKAVAKDDKQAENSAASEAAMTKNEKRVAPREGYSFTTSYRKNTDDLCDAMVLHCKNGTKSQDFTFEFNWPKRLDLLEEDGSGEIAETDINFDGVPDVVVLLGDFGVNPEHFTMQFYGACVWNEAKESFELAEGYDKIVNAKPTSDGKIESKYTTVFGSDCTDYYIWKDGVLVEEGSDGDAE